jgi:beta-galactosidase
MYGDAMKIRVVIAASVLSLLLAWEARTQPAPSVGAGPNEPLKQLRFAVQGNQFLLNGEPFQIISGELHYSRIPREYWRARLKMARAMGLNTVSTYG